MKKLTTKKLTDSAAAIIANSKSTLSTQEELAGGYSNFVLDMLHLKTPDVKVTGPGKAVGPDYIDRTSARSLQKALSAASKASPITSLVVTHPLGKTGKGGIRIPYAVTVTKETDPGATEHYATFTLKIEPLTIPSCKTVIKVIFSRDVAEGASKYQIAVQANPTSLLTGQNTWPMQPITNSLRGDLAVQFAAPFVVIIAVCQHANPNFQPSPDLASTFLRGRYIVQNVQFAISVKAPEKLKQMMITLLGLAYESRAVMCENGELETYTIGQSLRVKATIFEKPLRDSTDGRMSVQTALMRKLSGTHYSFSLSCYDKVQEMGLSNESARVEGLNNLLRFDFTLQDRGLDKLLTDAGKLAKKSGLPMPLMADGKRGWKHHGHNLIEALNLIDCNFATQLRGKKMTGLAAWLTTGIAHREFFLSELFACTEVQRDKLTALFRKLATKDERYGTAFKAWSKDRTGNRNLREHLKAVGLPKSSITRQMRAIKALGFSGAVPFEYYRDRDALWESYGSSRKDRDKKHKLQKAGKSVLRILERNSQNLQPALDAVRLAVESAADQSSIKTVEVAGKFLAPGAGPTDKLTPTKPTLAITASKSIDTFAMFNEVMRKAALSKASHGRSLR